MRKNFAIFFLCLVMVLAGCTPPAQETTPPTQETTLPSEEAWKPHYNQRNPRNSSVSYGMTETKGDDLSEEQLQRLLPGDMPSWVKAQGYYRVYWLHTADGLKRLEELDYVQLMLTTTWQDENIRLLISREPSMTTDVGREGDTPSLCNDIKYWLYAYTLPGAVRTNLEAYAKIGDYWYHFAAHPKPDNASVFKEDMKAILESFACLEKPDLSVLDVEEMVYPIAWTPVYNEHQCGLQAARSLPEGTTKRTLSSQELAALLPNMILAEMKTTGYVYFRADDNLYYLVMQLEYQDERATVLLGDGIDWGACCLSLCMTKEGGSSLCGNAEYKLYQAQLPKGKRFIACGMLQQIPVLVRIDSSDPDRDQPVFEKILGDLAWYHHGGLDLASLKP